MTQENNNEVVYKWVKVESEKDLPDKDGKYIIRFKTDEICRHPFYLQNTFNSKDFWLRNVIEWLKEIKPVPQSLPILLEIESIKKSAEQKKVGTRFPNEAWIEADAILMVCDHLLKFNEGESQSLPISNVEDKKIEKVNSFIDNRLSLHKTRFESDADYNSVMRELKVIKQFLSTIK